MPLDTDQLDELKSSIAVARKRDLNFALCLGKKPENTVILTHRIKGPEILSKQAKKAGETAKLAYGTMRVKGKDMMLTCLSDAPSGAARKTKEFLKKSVGLQMKVKLLSPDGTVLEEDGEGVEEDAVKDADAPDPNMKKWELLFTKYEPLVAKAASSGRGDPSKLRAVWNYTIDVAGDGDYAGAIKIFPKIDQLVKLAAAPDNTQSESGGSKEETAWNVQKPQIAKLLEAVEKVNPEGLAKLQAAWMKTNQKADAGDFAGALKVAKVLVPKLREIQKNSGAPTEETEAPDVEEIVEAPIESAVQFQKARLIWSTCRSQMMSEMRKLESAIVAACKNDDELEDVADEATELVERLDVFDERLQDTLDDITNAEHGPARDRLKKEAKEQIVEYATALKTGFFADIDKKNGFIDVAIAASARQSLQAISAALK